ncbi:protein translocase subunit SecF [Thermocrinis sp.]|uniref:protein translocase subunit SecF n=1 Tax=Thermocrinis sp. TaxID=2024383 RepID=UPI002FDCA921
MKYKNYAYAVSLTLVLLSVFLIFWKGLNLGLDFTGGTLVEVKFEKQVSLGEIRKRLEEVGIKAFQVQDTTQGTVIIRLRLDEPRDKAISSLKGFGENQVLRVESIGEIISKELRSKALWAIITALLGILVYLAYRFEPIWGLGAILALAHDVVIVVGAYSLTQLEVSLDVIASVLIVAGYSVTDTVVVFDRIRENLRIRKGLKLKEVIDLSINQTLSRTIMTSVTTFVVSAVLFAIGGPALSKVMFAFVVGVVVGTLSSIFVASAFVLDIKRLMVKEEVT